MKKIIKLMLVVGVAAMLSTACEMERFPDNSIIYKDEFSSIRDARALRSGLYIRLRGIVLGEYSLITEFQSDLFNPSVDYGNRRSAVHQMSNDLPAENSYLPGVWGGLYAAIKDVNIFIERIGEVDTTRMPGETNVYYADTLKHYKAEAHYIRAFAYYSLVKNFGGHPGGEFDAYGVPIVTRWDMNARPSRASSTAVYEFILDDLTLAYNNFVGSSVNRELISKNAILALRSKIYLQLGRMAEAAETAELLISQEILYPLSSTVWALREQWRNNGLSEDIFTLYASATEVSNTNIFSLFINLLAGEGGLQDGLYGPEWFPTLYAVNLYAANDIRSEVFLSNTSRQIIYLDGQRRLAARFLTKWPETSNFSINLTTNHKPKVHRIAEQYLIAAEARGNTTEGWNHLQKLRTARGVSTPAINAGNYLTILREEWAREMIGEGVRIECLKRWGVGFGAGQYFPGREPQPTLKDVIAGGDQQLFFSERIVPANSYLLILPIPEAEIGLNGNLIQTPGW
jgi:hypothetical protein